MLKEYKNIAYYKCSLFDSCYRLKDLTIGYIATYTNNQKLIYLCVADSMFYLYFQNKLYFVCPIEKTYLIVYELNNLLSLYGTNKVISTSF